MGLTAYQKVFDSDDYSNDIDMSFNDTLKSFPQKFNVHIGTWIGGDSLLGSLMDDNVTEDDLIRTYDPTTIYQSSFMSYKASDLNGNVINQTNFNEVLLPIFTSYSLTNTPLWTNVSSLASIFHKSQIHYSPATQGG